MHKEAGCAHTNEPYEAIGKVVRRTARRGAGHLADAVGGLSSKELDVVHSQALKDCQQQQVVAWVCRRAAHFQYSSHYGPLHVCFWVNDVPCRSSAVSLALVHCHSVLRYPSQARASTGTRELYQ